MVLYYSKALIRKSNVVIGGSKVAYSLKKSSVYSIAPNKFPIIKSNVISIALSRLLCKNTNVNNKRGQPSKAKPSLIHQISRFSMKILTRKTVSSEFIARRQHLINGLASANLERKADLLEMQKLVKMELLGVFKDN